MTGSTGTLDWLVEAGLEPHVYEHLAVLEAQLWDDATIGAPLMELIRIRIAQILQNALTEGRITMPELEERLDTVYSAKTLKELEPPISDLPGCQDSGGAEQQRDHLIDRPSGGDLKGAGGVAPKRVPAAAPARGPRLARAGSGPRHPPGRRARAASAPARPPGCRSGVPAPQLPAEPPEPFP